MVSSNPQHPELTSFLLRLHSSGVLSPCIYVDDFIRAIILEILGFRARVSMSFRSPDSSLVANLPEPAFRVRFHCVRLEQKKGIWHTHRSPRPEKLHRLFPKIPLAHTMSHAISQYREISRNCSHFGLGGVQKWPRRPGGLSCLSNMRWLSVLLHLRSYRSKCQCVLYLSIVRTSAQRSAITHSPILYGFFPPQPTSPETIFQPQHFQGPISQTNYSSSEINHG